MQGPASGAGTPAPSGNATPGAGNANGPPQGAGTPGGSNPSEASYRAIIEFLNRRGHTKAAQSLAADLSGTNGSGTTNAAGTGQDGPSPGSSPQPSGGGRAVGLEDFASRNAPSQPREPTPGQPGQQPPRRRPDQAVASVQLLADPPSWEKGYEGLRNFVENSLDIHRPELQPLLLPLFVHSYLDLVLVGYRDAADQFLERFSVDHNATDPHIVRMLGSIRNVNHVTESEDATRWRQERYHVRLSERGWGLLLGWLQGGGLAGSIEGTDARGRDRVLAIINERVRVDAVPGPPSRTQTEHGLASDIQGRRAARSHSDLKLGPAPVDPRMAKEVARATSNDQDSKNGESGVNGVEGVAATNGGVTAMDTTDVDRKADGATSSSLPPLMSPFPAEMLPYPTALRTIDVMREVEKVREARKRIKLGAEAYDPTKNGTTAVLPGSNEKGKTVGAAKPSVCLFTVHDAGDSLISTAFAEDSSLMAAGFSESYIRIWSLKGEKLPTMRLDFDSDAVIDAKDMQKLRHKDGPTTRKLVGHSGPVYALSFDPVPGPSGPPRYLLGHREPVWDVEWGPRGIYFATASRDRTARLWSTDKTNALRIFAGHLSDVNCVKFHPNSLYLATGSSDRTCRLWDVQKGMCVRVFVGHRAPITTIAMSPDGRWLASAAEDLAIIVWDLASGRKVKAMTGHTSPIYSLSFSAESTVLVSGSADATVRVWDVLARPTSEEEDDGNATSGAVNERIKNGAVASRVSFGQLKEKAKRLGSANGVHGAGSDATGDRKVNKLALFSDQEPKESADLLGTLATKRTPVFGVKFTPRNLCMAAGVMQDA
ncbi:Transcription initiation factor TFIID subunit 5 [Microbotryomycetes sp. JL221]|nr:Transcription initiation factor TFIID subunit 5 [Microbotryomycetes sp. JL221]